MNLIRTFAMKQLTQTQVCVYVGLVWCVLSVCVCVCVCFQTASSISDLVLKGHSNFLNTGRVGKRAGELALV